MAVLAKARFDLPFDTPNAVRFVPVDLRVSYVAIVFLNAGNTLHLSPARAAVCSAEPR